MLWISLDPQTTARVIAASRDTPDVLWIIKKSLQPFFFFSFWWTFKLVWWTSKGTCVILNYDFDSFYFSVLMARVRHPRIFHHKLREFNLEKQKMKRAFWKSRYLWLLKSTDAFVLRKELQLCLMSFFLNKCVYTFYALVPAWIKIISLSALNLTFFFFFLVEVMAAVSVCVLRTRLRVAQTAEGHETPQVCLVIQTVSLWRWKPSSRLQKSDWLPMPPFAPLAPPRPNLLSLQSHNVMYSNLPPGSPHRY